MAPSGTHNRVFNSGRVAVGMAYSRTAARLVDELSDVLDYVEYPYELLVSSESVAAEAGSRNAILHSASLSLASADPPSVELACSVADVARRLSSPWIGEHLAFISARPSEDAPRNDPIEQFDIGFTVSPPMNAQTIDNVTAALTVAYSATERPFIIENSPIYLWLPGSTMPQSQVLVEICQQADTGLLFDLAHLLITCDTLALDPMETIRGYPLDRVVEVHLSGVHRESGVLWDDHSITPDSAEYDLLRVVLDEAPVKAITHEYNWPPELDVGLARREVDRTLDLIVSRT